MELARRPFPRDSVEVGQGVMYWGKRTETRWGIFQGIEGDDALFENQHGELVRFPIDEIVYWEYSGTSVFPPFYATTDESSFSHY